MRRLWPYRHFKDGSARPRERVRSTYSSVVWSSRCWRLKHPPVVRMQQTQSRNFVKRLVDDSADSCWKPRRFPRINMVCWSRQSPTKWCGTPTDPVRWYCMGRSCHKTPRPGRIESPWPWTESWDSVQTLLRQRTVRRPPSLTDWFLCYCCDERRVPSSKHICKTWNQPNNGSKLWRR